MKIVGLRAWPVRVPRLERFLPKTAHGETRASEYVILELQTDAGITGVGEVTCAPRWNGEDAATSVGLLRDFAGRLRGADPGNWRAVAAVVDVDLVGRPFLRAALEMACLDVTGRALGVPVATLLGGIRATQIPTKIVLPARDTDTVAAMARDAIGLGAQALKVKVGLDPAGDIARVRAVREVAGDAMRITVDANEGWRPADLGTTLDALLDLDVCAVEQPLRRAAWVETAAHRVAGMRFVGDESIWSWTDVFRNSRHEAFDVLSLYPGKCGGLRRTVSMAECAAGLGLGVTYGSNLELGVGAAALAHAAAATPVLCDDVPADLIGPLYFASSIVTDASFVAWSGGHLPSGPGLGVELDRGALHEHVFRI